MRPIYGSHPTKREWKNLRGITLSMEFDPFIHALIPSSVPIIKFSYGFRCESHSDPFSYVMGNGSPISCLDQLGDDTWGDEFFYFFGGDGMPADFTPPPRKKKKKKGFLFGPNRDRDPCDGDWRLPH